MIYKITFHEMAHASHFKGLGNGAANYWANEYIDMLFGWLEVLLNKKNPLTNCYNDGKSERVCFIESWGYFFGDYLMDKHYKNKTRIEYDRRLSDSNYTEYSYFYNQAYYSMTDRGYPIKDIFNIYKKHDVYSARSFVDEFAKSYHLNSTQKNELEVLLKSKGAKL